MDISRVVSEDDGAVVLHYLPRFYQLTKLCLLNMGVGKFDVPTDKFRELSTLTALKSLDVSTSLGILIFFL